MKRLVSLLVALSLVIGSIVAVCGAGALFGDVDGDGEISIMDATSVQLYVARIIDKFPGEPEDEPDIKPVKQDLTQYKSYVQKAIDDSKTYSEYISGVGTLCDIDSNGVKELIMIYYDWDYRKAYIKDFEVPSAFMSVYTMENNVVVPLVEGHCLHPMAGGPQVEISLMKKDGETLLGVQYSEADPNDNYTLRVSGTWSFYEINGTDFEVFDKYDYRYIIDWESDYIYYSESSAICDGMYYGYDDFENWVNSYDNTVLLNSNVTDNATNLSALLKSLK